MKKTYMMPLTAIVKVAVQQIMAGSPFHVNANGDLTGGELQSGNASSAAMSRSNSLWDDEEEE